MDRNDLYNKLIQFQEMQLENARPSKAKYVAALADKLSGGNQVQALGLNKQPQPEELLGKLQKLQMQQADAQVQDEEKSYKRNRQAKLDEFKEAYNKHNLKKMGLEGQLLDAKIKALNAEANVDKNSDEWKRKNLKALKPNENEAFSAGRQMPGLLATMNAAIGENKDIMGPLTGRLKSANPFSERGQKFNATSKAITQLVGKFMEGGVMRKEDEKKYREMLPQLSDLPEVAEFKAQQLQQFLTAKYNDWKQAVEMSGYYVPEPNVHNQNNKTSVKPEVKQPASLDSALDDLFPVKG
jgi:hypothetical protein